MNKSKLRIRIGALLLGFMILGFGSCGDSSDGSGPLGSVATDPIPLPGVYERSVEGFNGGSYTLTVELVEKGIRDIIYSSTSTESAGVGAAALPVLREKVLDLQSVGVDTVSGATMTSMKFLAAVKDVLETALAPSSYIDAPSLQVTNQTVEADVLVIGSGIAGLSAAVQAKDTKPEAKVIVIEKQEIIGGSTKVAAGVVYGALNEADQGALADYYMMRSDGKADQTMVTFFANNSLSTLSFLEMDGPAVFGSPSGTATESRMRMDFTKGGLGIVQNLYNRAIARGVIVLTGVKGTELIYNGTAVTGAKAESKTIKYTFNVKGGVVIAAGGFDSDHNGLMAQYNSDSQYDIPQSNHGNVGEGIKMALDIGADNSFQGGKVGWVAIDYSINDSHYYARVVKTDGTLLDLTPLEASVTYAQHEDDYAVVHRRMLEARKVDSNVKFWAISNSAPNPTYAANGWAFTNTTIAGLATQIGADATKLQQSFASGKEISNMFGPGSVLTATGTVFTATKALPSSIGSMGGLKINTNAAVLKGGQPIPGLFAAGESANGQLFYKEYPGSGSSLAVSSTFGRQAGKNAATRALP
jgi:fumarate reductase flavoprotein subunit